MQSNSLQSVIKRRCCVGQKAMFSSMNRLCCGFTAGYVERPSALKVHRVLLHFVPLRPFEIKWFSWPKAHCEISLYTGVPTSDLSESQFHLIPAHLCPLRFKCCSECGSCKHRHEKHDRWREKRHAEGCVHSPPTCAHCVWSKPHTFEVCMPLCWAK